MYQPQRTDKAKSYGRDYNLHTYILFGIQYDYPIGDELLLMMIASHYNTPGLTYTWQSEGLDWDDLDNDRIRTICTSNSISITMQYADEKMPARTFIHKLSSDSLDDGLEVWTLSFTPPKNESDSGKAWTQTTQRYVNRQYVMDFYDDLRYCDIEESTSDI